MPVFINDKLYKMATYYFQIEVIVNFSGNDMAIDSTLGSDEVGDVVIGLRYDSNANASHLDFLAGPFADDCVVGQRESTTFSFSSDTSTMYYNVAASRPGFNYALLEGQSLTCQIAGGFVETSVTLTLTQQVSTLNQIVNTGFLNSAYTSYQNYGISGILTNSNENFKNGNELIAGAETTVSNDTYGTTYYSGETSCSAHSNRYVTLQKLAFLLNSNWTSDHSEYEVCWDYCAYGTCYEDGTFPPCAGQQCSMVYFCPTDGVCLTQGPCAQDNPCYQDGTCPSDYCLTDSQFKQISVTLTEHIHRVGNTTITAGTRTYNVAVGNTGSTTGFFINSDIGFTGNTTALTSSDITKTHSGNLTLHSADKAIRVDVSSLGASGNTVLSGGVTSILTSSYTYVTRAIYTGVSYSIGSITVDVHLTAQTMSAVSVTINETVNFNGSVDYPRTIYDRDYFVEIFAGSGTTTLLSSGTITHPEISASTSTSTGHTSVTTMYIPTGNTARTVRVTMSAPSASIGAVTGGMSRLDVGSSYWIGRDVATITTYSSSGGDITVTSRTTSTSLNCTKDTCLIN